MAVTAPIGTRPSGVEEIFIRALALRKQAEMAQRQMEHAEKLAQLREQAELARQLALKEYEEGGKAHALTEYFRQNPELARAFGYEEVQMPPPGPRAEHEPATATVRPVPRPAASATFELLREHLRGTRAEEQEAARLERMLRIIGLKGEQARALQAQKDVAAMERLEKALEARKGIVKAGEDIRLKLARLREDEAFRRLAFSERQKNVRATIQPEVAKLLGERVKLRQDLATYQAVAADPEADPVVRQNARLQAKVTEEALDELKALLSHTEKLATEAAQAVELGPATTPPEQRPQAPPIKPQYRWDPQKGRIIRVK